MATTAANNGFSSNDDETSRLLVPIAAAGGENGGTMSDIEGKVNDDNNSSNNDDQSLHHHRRRPATTIAVAVVIVAVIAVVGSVDWAAHSRRVIRDAAQQGAPPSAAAEATSTESSQSSTKSSTSTKPSSSPKSYTQFQALGLSLYTGGAPLYLPSTGTRNPECDGRHALGHLDQDDDNHNAANTKEVNDRDHLYCYLGHANDTVDVQHRLHIMKEAVERAHEVADPDPSVLKVFIAPEFFWRGQDGAYFFDESESESDLPDDSSSCGEVCQVLSGLENLTANSSYQDWLFLMGTVITAEKLPQNDTWDYLFLNFAPLYRGYDPDRTTHVGQRFLVPKRYVSNIDFLTPLRHYNATLARQIIDETAAEAEAEEEDRHESKRSSHGKQDASSSSAATTASGGGGLLINDTAVFNPFLDRGRYSNHVWDSYKAELNRLEYTMIEYGWLVVDDIVLTVEVCLDHDMGTALNSYTADAVTGRTTRIPRVSSFDSTLQTIPIPASMAQLSLVSSAGMTINRGSIAATHDGYVFLQDGLNDKTSRMFYETECYAGLSFEGGTELVQRSALLTPNEVVFQHRHQDPANIVPVYPRPNDWRKRIRGIFSTAKYEPGLVVYPVLGLPAPQGAR
jgi:hypothetical protein